MTGKESGNMQTALFSPRQMAAVAAGTEAAYDGRQLVLEFFGTPYRLTPESANAPEDTPVTEKIIDILANFVSKYPAKPPAEHRLVSFRELAGAGPLVVSFANNTNKTITAAFAGGLSALESAAATLGGRPVSDASGYDLAVRFTALPGIPLYLHFNDAETSFPAQSSLLMESSIETYLELPAIFALGTFLCGSLVSRYYDSC